MILFLRKFIDKPNTIISKKSLFSKKMAFFSGATSSKICYYKVLNISTNSTMQEIRKSYLELAKIYHPDINTGERIQEVVIFLL